MLHSGVLNLFTHLAWSAVTRSIILTYAAFLIRTLVPVIVLPFLAHRLGAANLGAVLAGQSLALTGCIVIEWGFNLSGVREVSAAQHDDRRIPAVVTQIMSARLTLAPLVFAGVCALAWSTPVLGEGADRIIMTGIYAVVLGLTPLWYFQGRGRPALAAVLELAAAVIALVAILLLVRSPSDITLALLALALGPMLSFGFGLGLMYRDAKVRPWRIKGAWQALHQGLPIFLVYASASLQTVASTWLIAFLSSAEQAAFYGVAHRLTNIVIAASFEPIAQVAVARSVHLAQAPFKLWRFTLRLLAVHLGLAAGGVLGLYLLAGFAIRLVFSPQMMPAAATTYTLSLALLPLALSRTFNFYWLVPNRRDRQVAVAVAAGGLLVVGLAVAFAPSLGAAAMAWARVAGELLTASLVLVFSWRALRVSRQSSSEDTVSGHRP